ncbi:MAG: mechanosensitive ion channel [Bacteroidales bacterium]|nr:mechanosensitive ion channel [Bacteroidales bacterium]
MMDYIISWFEHNIGSESSTLEWYWRLAIIFGIVAISFLVDALFSYLVIPAVKKIVEKTETKVDDILLDERVCRAFSNIIPAIILTGALPFVTQGTLEVVLARLTVVYIIICVTRFLCILIGAAFRAYAHLREGKAHSLKGVVQTVQIIVSGIAVILSVSALLDKSPAIILSGLGAMAAVMMLVFQDSIKGLVAGIQLAFNDMLVQGDWITMPSRHVDGVVIEISLTTVKVRNWDNTILTIPPYKLLEESFQNWRGMQQSNGRRFCRQVNIDVRSITFAEGDTTNLQQFRAHLYNYLSNHPAVNTDMTLMVRQLPMVSEGIPVQIYGFTRTKVWQEYEDIQAQLVEYMVASMKEYGLLPFQRSGGLPATK